jgi:23S rRNA A2030 N6-methylase RlmJ
MRGRASIASTRRGAAFPRGRDGILRLAGAAPRSAALLAYLRVVAALPENGTALRCYPGSPLLAAGLLGETTGWC